MKNLIFISLGLFLFSTPVLPSDKVSFVEDNSFMIGINDSERSSITRSTFLSIIEKVTSIYAPIISRRGARLVVAKSWIDPTVNAFAEQDGKKWKVTFYGGLARHKFMTEDGFAMVVCHELAHHIGGAPKKTNRDWPSTTEGQSDYWAALKCFRKVFENDDNVTVMQGKVIDPLVASSCANIFVDLNAKAVCERSAQAGFDLGKFFADLAKENPPAFDTPDPTVASSAMEDHPKAQCRLDTILAGSLCNKNVSEDVSDQDSNAGVCIQGGILEGARPACWYKKN